MILPMNKDVTTIIIIYFVYYFISDVLLFVSLSS